MKDVIIRFQEEYRFLSNFWVAPIRFPVPVRFGNKINEYAITNEHAFQALKAAHYADFLAILNLARAGEAKKRGREIECISEWTDIRLQVMYDINCIKYKTYNELRRKLLATGDRKLIEGNTWGDEFWGVDLTTMQGENHLGKILMRIREELK